MNAQVVTEPAIIVAQKRDHHFISLMRIATLLTHPRIHRERKKNLSNAWRTYYKAFLAA